MENEFKDELSKEDLEHAHNLGKNWGILIPLGKFKDCEHEVPEVKWDMTPPMWKVWTEGYIATGEHGTATYHGEVRAETFVEACKIILGHHKDFEVREPIEVPSESGRLGLKRMGINQETVCFLWACRCYDNEVDARKSFG